MGVWVLCVLCVFVLWVCIGVLEVLLLLRERLPLKPVPLLDKRADSVGEPIPIAPVLLGLDTLLVPVLEPKAVAEPVSTD